MKLTKSFAAVAALALAASASPVLAQNTADPYATTTAPADDDDGDKGLWGLLGLLGLAGLLGMKRRDRDHDVGRTGTGTNNR
jgi:MYXO-CTERM domain-containing protein